MVTVLSQVALAVNSGTCNNLTIYLELDLVETSLANISGKCIRV
jgi:hypothetical protein